MILVYTEELTPRVEYIFKVFFNQIYKSEISFTTNSSDFVKSELPKINYSTQKFADEFYIKPHRLLFCKALIPININSVWFENNKYFCESSTDSDLPFDPFAAAFYVVSRYEEYTVTERDKFGRFQAKNSILSKYNLLDKPVVNSWAKLLTAKLCQKYPALSFEEPKFDFQTTIDIDNAWAVLHKGFWRTTGALLKLAVKGNFGELNNRLKIQIGKQPDPYDTYEYLDHVFAGIENRVKFFFLLGDYSRYDKNISFNNKHLKKLIINTAQKYEVGIHPSFQSAKKKAKKRMAFEKQRLENIINKNITCSRQHYLRLKFPATYKRLLKAGINTDFTMGYAEQTGFRAGICTPFYFYDLKREKTTNLLLVPFQVMDGTLRHYLKLSPDLAFEEIKKLMTEVKNCGGTFVSIWHNETVTDKEIWKGYREVFEKTIKMGNELANEQ